jgi:hypothetical protein
MDQIKTLYEVYRTEGGQLLAYPRLLWIANPSALQGPRIWFVAVVEAATKEDAILKALNNNVKN